MSVSSSSYDSSELDDIELNQPSRAVYESDVPTLFERTRRDYQHDADLVMPTARPTPSLPFRLPLPAAAASQPVNYTATPRRSFDNPADSALSNAESSRHFASDVTSDPAHSRTHPHPTPPAETSEPGRVTVDLLSSAFVLDNRLWEQCAARGYTPADVITRRTCRGLGIDRSDLTFFELREVPVDELRTQGQYAVRVNRAEFSLRGIEDLMTENKSLQSNNSKCTSSIEAMQSLLRQINEERSQLYLKSEEHQADVRRLQERCRVAEGHVKLLKQHVQRSDDRYASAKQQLDALKSDVVEMARAAPKAPQHSAATPLSARRHTAANGSTTPLSESHKSGSANGLPVEAFMDVFKNSWDGSQHRNGSMTARTSYSKPPSPAAMDRVLAVMEQFSRSQGLAKLEQLLTAAGVTT